MSSPSTARKTVYAIAKADAAAEAVVVVAKVISLLSISSAMASTTFPILSSTA